jgi:hypothetical protein
MKYRLSNNVATYFAAVSSSLTGERGGPAPRATDGPGVSSELGELGNEMGCSIFT